ncbi:MAG TPA: DNA glycosylase [Candidatus Eisenbacteria bacterium]
MRHRLPIQGPLDLDLTFSCGQAFRWRADRDAWLGVVGSAALRVSLDGRWLEVDVRGSDPGPGALARYFRLEEDPAVHLAHAEELRAIPGLTRLLGLRLLHQDPWETVASFICSAAANIRKITACVEGLAARFGSEISGSPHRTFPGVERLARSRESELRALGLGFRAPFLLATARRLAEGPWDWEALRDAPIEEARARLVALPGVGPKIADCALLFGVGRLDAYPVDRWIRRATLELKGSRRARDEDLARWAARFGPGRGYLQQLLFHLRRTGGPLPRLPGERPRPRRTARARAGS